eukprot:142058_1
MSTTEHNSNAESEAGPGAINHDLDLNHIECEIKLVNNWKKLKLRSRFSFSMIDPMEIKAMMINYYQIYCPLETKLEFGAFGETFEDIPDINEIVSFVNEPSHQCVDHASLLSIQIELPLLVLPILHNDDNYFFYAFANGKLLLYQTHEEIHNIMSVNKNKIRYQDILSIFHLNHAQYRLAHPKNSHLELNLNEQLNMYEVNELQLEIIKSPRIDRCVICLSSVSYEFAEYCRISSCSHMYHFECVENLIKYGNDNQCPLCRKKVKYVQYLYSNTINKIFKIKNDTLTMINNAHYLNKYYHNIKYRNRSNAREEDNHAQNEEYDEKDEGIISRIIPQKPCLGYLESMPSPTNSNSSISIPPTRHSSPSLTHLQLNNTCDSDTNHENLNGNENNNNYNGNNDNDQNNNNGNNNAYALTKSYGFFETNHDKTAGEDD